MDRRGLILQAVEDSNIGQILNLLKEKGLLKFSKKCPICKNELKEEEIGGFIPDHKKIVPICGDPMCVLKASFLVMKHNGNGSPIIENVR